MAGLDGYDLRARLTPGYLVLSPFVLSVVVLAAEHLSVLTAAAALLVGLGAPCVLASLVRDRGKAIEPQLWSQWGGAPATAMLRASSSDPVTADYRRKAQERTGSALPSALAHKQDAAAADHEIQSVVNDLIKQTRSEPVVQSELSDYGMRRNLLGMRDLGLLCSALTLGVGVGDLVSTLTFSSGNPLAPIVIIGLGVLGVLAWHRVSAAWVKVAANRYAAALLT